ncbi:MAG: HAMP domain-containing histidine kinase [Fidelibacterota bacterium]|nr:MAG: HAMP domain-containing histidine kinase [Candidatus Neomarinimicrobiota bacterium]
MTKYSYTVNLKTGLFALGVLIVAGLLWYSRSLVQELQDNERRLVDLYANMIAEAASEEGGEELGFIFDQVIQQIQFPVVITTPEGEAVSWRNIEGADEIDPDDRQTYLGRIVARMDEIHSPVAVRYGELVISRIHYGDSSIVSRLRWLPYVEIAVVGLFILVGFMGFTMIRNSEKRSIWAGMARETAHQLGTPVSSLMGWIDILRNKVPGDLEALDELESDVHRLEQITDRFHKVGSVPKFEDLDLLMLAESSAAYFRQRLPTASETTITVSGDSVMVPGAETLLQWTLENLIKNALDACHGRKGIIEVRVAAVPAGGGSIEVCDNGVGISPRDRRNIFRPGYSTKSRGWGLGLSLARRIVKDIHRGKLRLASSKPGETVIRMTLPGTAREETGQDM